MTSDYSKKEYIKYLMCLTDYITLPYSKLVYYGEIIFCLPTKKKQFKMQQRQLNPEKIYILFIGKFNFLCYTTEEEGVISY